MSGKRVAALEAALLPLLIGDIIEVRRSVREGAKYPLYLSTKVGPLHLNTRAGQDFLLEHARFDGPNGPEESPAIPDVSPLVKSVISAPDENSAKPAPVAAYGDSEARPKKRLSAFFATDEGLGI